MAASHEWDEARSFHQEGHDPFGDLLDRTAEPGSLHGWLTFRLKPALGSVASNDMAFRRGGSHWYDLILVVLAAAIVYPDKILDWMGECTGRSWGWLHLILIEMAALASMVMAMVLLMPAYPRLEWWHAIFYVGLLAMIRGITWLVLRLFGFDD